MYGEAIKTSDQNDIVSKDHAFRRKQLLFAAEIIFTTSITIVKVAILFGYLELFGILKWTKRLIWFMIVTCVLLWAVNAGGLLAACYPIRTNDNATPKSKCRGIPRQTEVIGFILSNVINAIQDFVLVAIPLSVLWKLQMDTLKKIGVSLMFGLGLVYVSLQVHMRIR